MSYTKSIKKVANLTNHIHALCRMKWWMLLLFMGSLTVLPAQDLQFFALRDIWQLQQLQPAYMPNKKITVGIMGLQFETKRRGLSWSDVFRTSRDTLYINPSRGIQNAALENYYAINVDVPTFFAAVRFDPLWSFSISYRLRSYNEVMIPRDVFRLLLHGNGQLINEKLYIGLGSHFMNYRELGLGIARQWNDWKFGVRVSLLTGKFLLYTPRRELYFTTHDDWYQWTVESNYRLMSSNVVPEAVNTTLQFFTGGLVPNFRNIGASISLGATYRWRDILDLHASVTDIGFIRWGSSNSMQLSITGTSTFTGFQDFINLDSLTLSDTTFTNLIDTTKRFFEELDYAVDHKFRTSLPWSLVLGADYQLNRHFRTGMVYRFAHGKLLSDHQLMIYLSFYPWKFLQLGTSFNVQSGSQQLGIYSSLKLAFIKTYLSLNRVYKFSGPSTGYFNFTAGVNISIGKLPKHPK